MVKALKNGFEFIASYGFACVVFLLLLLLVFLGTIEQVDHGLYEVQKRYFESLFLVHWFEPFGGRLAIPLPLPGVYLLLILFTVNLIAGGIVRMRKNKNTVGNLIIHGGMLFMIAGGFVNFKFAQDGHMTLAESQHSDEFVSYYDWEIAIAQPENGVYQSEYLVPHERLAYLAPEDSAAFTRDDLPFELVVEGFQRNCQPMAMGPMMPHEGELVDGFTLHGMPLDKEAERNIAGAYATVREKKSGATQKAILWGFSAHPWTVTVDGKPYLIDLRHRRYALPFTIVLDKFTHELHPRTQMAKTFMSDVTKIENGVSQAIKITMNEPLRHKGYTFYQASWQPANPQLGTPVKSTLAVVKNPADQWPLYSCIVISAGLLIHFTAKLLKYLRAENKRLAARGATT